MPKHNSLLEERFFLAAVIFCHDKHMSQKDHVRETLARSALDLHHSLLKMRGAFVARHRLRKQVSIKAKTQKNNLFLSYCFLDVKDRGMSAVQYFVMDSLRKVRTDKSMTQDLGRGKLIIIHFLEGFVLPKSAKICISSEACRVYEAPMSSDV